jgi:short subunit dehydrogenase-like uncharacterized protein
MLLPGAGFDVVPSDCLAAHLKRRLPGATHLALAFQPSGGLSRGTATTMVENLHRGGMVRRDGALTPVPLAWKTRRIDFGRGPRPAVTIPWGDVSTAYHSTGIPNIEVYIAAKAAMRFGLKAARPFRGLLASEGVRAFLKRRIQAGPPGPDAEARRRGSCRLWGEVRDAAGAVARSRLRTPEGYALTAMTAVALAERTLAGQASPGFQTPSRLCSPDFILSIDGCVREDLP